MMIILSLAFVIMSISLTAGYQSGPDDCSHNGHFYPLHSLWASTVPLECVEYKCHPEKRMTKRECKPEPPTPSPNCYPVAVPDNYFPYCCSKYVCITHTTSDSGTGDCPHNDEDNNISPSQDEDDN